MHASSSPGTPFGLPRDIAWDENALSAAQRASVRDMVLSVPISAAGLIELCRLGWLDPNQLRNSAAVEAVIELTNAALSVRLRPNMIGKSLAEKEEGARLNSRRLRIPC
jgi:hypothetical protein